MCIYIFIIKSDLKNLTSAIASDIVTDLNSLKDNIESNYKAYVGQLRDIEKDASDKAQRLSHYVDEEISKVIVLIYNNYSWILIN